MDHRIIINQSVNVTAVYFQKSGLKTFPRRIEFDGTTYTFADGWQYLVKRGQAVVQIFDMTDGTANYRLRHEKNNPDWTLLTITSCL